MTEDEIRTVVIEQLTGVAPDIDAAGIDPKASFRDQFDIDSMDFLNFVIAVHERLGVDIPEIDYPKLTTLDGCVAYLAAKLGEQAVESAKK